MLIELATVAENLNRFDDAASLIYRVLEILDGNPDSIRSRGLDDALTAQGVLQWNRGKQQDAESAFHRVLKMREAHYPSMHPKVASASRRYGVALQARGAYDKAETMYRRALSIYERSLGPWHRDTALAVNSLATLYNDRGRPEDALPLARRFLEIAQQSMEPEDNLTAIAMGNLATILTETGRLPEAEALLRKAVDLFRESPIEQNVVWAERQLAATVMADGRPDEAVELLREAIRVREEAVGAVATLVLIISNLPKHAWSRPTWPPAQAIAPGPLISLTRHSRFWSADCRPNTRV